VLERCRTRLSNAKSEHSVRNLSVRLEASSHVLCYSGDGAPSAATRELYRGADVLVHECYAAVDPHEGHASLPMVLGLADACDVSTLCLLHLAAEEKQQIAARAESTAQRYRIILPTPGQTLEL
jgi:ribonuclease Z